MIQFFNYYRFMANIQDNLRYMAPLVKNWRILLELPACH